MSTAYSTLSEKTIVAQEQLLGMFELAQSRSVHLDKLLRGTGIFALDIEQREQTISPRQLLLLYQNARRYFPVDDCSFLLGQYLLPGNHPQFSRAVLASPTVQDVFELLLAYAQLALPLIDFRAYYSDSDLYVQLLSADVDDYQHDFLLEAVSSACLSLCRWLGADTSSWQYLHAFKAPAYREQYLVHYGTRPHFGAHINAIVIPRDSLHQVLPRGSRAQFDMAFEACELSFMEHERTPHRSLALAVYDRLQAHITHPPSLEQLAEYFDMSVATFKRYLKAEGRSYQQLLDSVRRHQAIYYLHSGQLNTEQIAAQLNYHDKHNFKRSFKRWTGLNPAAYFSN
ncbi:AraC family transcriptional regulator [Pseudoteredinibacter isoporae]|uniref:AraC-like DNA-binding protein n=1 Tax=Pseudoteredinibacter isoporae TaxID=570281 RepID=A0A7X0MUK9_9GAMM|nr:AraC family transcriptional regulator [Pseudoteredinibacter isoporae]MBB6520140.1 AraC-like DNA-binding protein [Pseudoteredinibacter isoporae]NHO85712.1 AraC family transcriptional regulator [Pseudoteredinibacter isoporae]NIB25836.1 AraC family transcriptional regulator [Pseudoteredinibacter isoporae]